MAVLLVLAGTAGPAQAAPPVEGYRATPLLVRNNPSGDFFETSGSGNPITAKGRVAGFVNDGPSVQAAVLDTRTGLAQTFDTAGSADTAGTSAADVNEQGDVVLSQQTRYGARTVFKGHDGSTVLLDELDGDTPISSFPAAVNDRGLVVGTLQRADGPEQAFLWDPAQSTKPQLLGTLGGGSSEALGINEAGYVVGSSTTRSGETHPFVWLPDKQVMADLGTLPGFTGGVARDINAGSYVVGEVTRQRALPRAFVWSPITHRMRGLATPAGQGSAAYAINYHGVIAGGLLADPGDLLPTVGAVWGGCTPVQTLPATGDVVFASGITRQERIVGYASGQPVRWEKAGPCT